jgi:hypothetical protein
MTIMLCAQDAFAPVVGRQRHAQVAGIALVQTAELLPCNHALHLVRERLEIAAWMRGRYAIERCTRRERRNTHTVQVLRLFIRPLCAQRLVERQFFTFARAKRILYKRRIIGRGNERAVCRLLVKLDDPRHGLQLFLTYPFHTSPNVYIAEATGFSGIKPHWPQSQCAFQEPRALLLRHLIGWETVHGKIRGRPCR